MPFPIANSTLIARRLLFGLMAALLVWGIYLAVGSFRHRAAQGALVLICSITFLTSWSLAMYGRSRRLQATEAKHQSAMNLASIFGFGCALIAASAYWFAIRTFDPQAMSASVSFGWAALATVATGTVASMVGLSNPRPKGGKLAGLAALLFFVAIFLTFIVRSSMPPRPMG